MSKPIHIAVGPQAPGFGSWQWLGEGLLANLQHPFSVETFVDSSEPPAADIVVYIKFLPNADRLADIAQRSSIVFLPVDMNASCSEIDNNREYTQTFSLVIVNSRRLLRYYHGYCPVEYLDHPLKYSLSKPRLTTDEGPVVWIGQICNIEPIVHWANSTELDRELWVLTNLGGAEPSPASLGFKIENVTVQRWSESLHMHCLEVASLAVDIKGQDFRSRHKPPAKVFDFLASGIPVIVNRGSSADIHLSALGYEPLYDNSWLSELNGQHRQLAFEFGQRLQATHNHDAVSAELTSLLHNVASTTNCKI